MKNYALNSHVAIFIFAAFLATDCCKAQGLELLYEDEIMFAATSVEVGFLGIRTEPLHVKITSRARAICEANGLTLYSDEREIRSPDLSPGGESIPPLTGKIYNFDSRQIDMVTESYAPKWKAFDRMPFSKSQKLVFAANICWGFLGICNVLSSSLRPNAIQKMESWSWTWWLLNTLEMNSFTLNIYFIKRAYECIRAHGQKLFARELSEAELGPGMFLQFPNPHDIAPHILFKKINCRSE